MTLVYLIRHGRPKAGWGDSDPDPGLDPVGLAQARAVAERFASLPTSERPTKVVSSPLRRCQETAAPTAAALGLVVEIDPKVGEIPTPGDLPHAERSQWLQSAFTGRWADIVGDIDYEVWRQAAAGAVAAHPRAAVFSHFVAINGVVSTITADSRVIVFRPDHCSVTTLGLGDHGLELVERGPEATTGVL